MSLYSLYQDYRGATFGAYIVAIVSVREMFEFHTTIGLSDVKHGLL
jgi:hypothetical protein